MLFRVLFSKANGESFNIGNPEMELSVAGLAKYVAEAMPYPVKIVHIDPPHAVYSNSDPKRRCPDISKIRKLTGFRPHYPLKVGLRRTIAWFSEFQS